MTGPWPASAVLPQVPSGDPIPSFAGLETTGLWRLDSAGDWVGILPSVGCGHSSTAVLFHSLLHLPASLEALLSEVLTLHSIGAVVEVSPATPGFYGWILVVPKTLGGFRPALDLSSPMSSCLSFTFAWRQPLQSEPQFAQRTGRLQWISKMPIFMSLCFPGTGNGSAFGGGAHIPICGPSVWSLSSPLGFFQNYQGGLLGCEAPQLSGRQSSVRPIAALLGQMESLAPLVPLGRLLKRELQRQFHRRWYQASQPWDATLQLVTGSFLQ